jgi:hypothetical protein
MTVRFRPDIIAVATGAVRAGRDAPRHHEEIFSNTPTFRFELVKVDAQSRGWSRIYATLTPLQAGAVTNLHSGRPVQIVVL